MHVLFSMIFFLEFLQIKTGYNQFKWIIKNGNGQSSTGSQNPVLRSISCSGTSGFNLPFSSWWSGHIPMAARSRLVLDYIFSYAHLGAEKVAFSTSSLVLGSLVCYIALMKDLLCTLGWPWGKAHEAPNNISCFRHPNT